MAANFHWCEANGAGQVISSGITDVNWKNIDDTTTVYSSSPITAGSNSYTKWQFGKFYGTYNQISNGYFGHTAGAFGTGVTLIGAPTMTSDANKLAYATPSTADASATLTKDMTTADVVTNGVVVWFSGTSPTATKTASTTANPAYTNYLTTQLKTTGSAAAGDTASITLTLRYDEN